MVSTKKINSTISKLQKMFSMRTGVVCDLKIIINPWQIL